MDSFISLVSSKLNDYGLNNNYYTWEIKEDFDSLELSLDIKRFFKELDADFFNTFFILCNENDKPNVCVDPDGIEAAFETLPSHETIEYINNQLFNENDTEDFELKILYSISKQIRLNTISVYLDNYFIKDDIENKGMTTLLKIYNEKFINNKIKVLELQNDSERIFYKSDLFSIISKSYPASIDSVSNERENIIYQRNRLTNPHNLGVFNLLPSDFNNSIDDIDVEETKFSHLIKHFLKIKIILSASFIANTSRVNDNDEFEMSVFEEHYLHIVSNYKKINISKAQVLFDIYKWVFEDTFSSEKLVLVRPIVSKNFEHYDFNWVLKKSTMDAINSAYTTYLKDNVKQYYETVSKATEVVAEVSIKNQELVRQAATSFKNNNLTVLSFFASIFIFNSLSNDYNKPIFNMEKYYLCLAFLFVSSIYWLMSYKQYYLERKQNFIYYINIKKLYKDSLLEKNDLNKLFSIKKYKDNLKSVDKIAIGYFRIWLIEIYVFLFLVVILTYLNVK